MPDHKPVWFTAVAVITLLFMANALKAEELPERSDPAFNQTCKAMYDARDRDEEWPAEPAGDAFHCQIIVETLGGAAMDADDYRWALRKSMTFACKGKREVLYDVVRLLKNCNAEVRTLAMEPAKDQPGACRGRIIETGQRFNVEPKLIDDLIEWKDNMPWYEAVLVDLFAPRELPMVMDGLIACGEGG